MIGGPQNISVKSLVYIVRDEKTGKVRMLRFWQDLTHFVEMTKAAFQK